MNLVFLLFFGFIFTLVLLCYFKPSFILVKNNKLNMPGGSFTVNDKTRYFPLLMSIYFIFIMTVSFQYISTNPLDFGIYANSFDLIRYKKLFNDSIDYSLPKYLLLSGQEPIYSLIIWCLRRITSSFSIVLAILYSFIFFSLVHFLKAFKPKITPILIISFFSLVFTFIITTFCLLRMGLAVSAILYAYSSLIEAKRRNSKFKTFFWSIIAVGFHFSATFFLIIYIMYKLFTKVNNLSTYFAIFIVLFIGSFLGSQLLRSLLSHFYSKFKSYNESAIAIGTYTSNFLFLVAILYRSKRFFLNKINCFHFIILTSSFFIVNGQIIMGVFYRMIFFTYPSIAIIISTLWEIYKPSKKELFVPILLRSFIIVYIVYFLFTFITESWISYGLQTFDLFYLN